MKIIKTRSKDLLIIEPIVHYDDRGYFFESYKNNSQPHEKLNNDVDTNDKELPSLFSNKKLKKVELLRH